MIGQSPPPELRVDGVTKTYGTNGVRANDRVDLTLRPGELVALIGHNGAGKTTLLNQIIGVARPDEGDIRLGGTSLVADPDFARRVCSMMPQLHAPLTGTTPSQAIAAIARLRGLGRAASRAATDELVTALDIADWRDRPSEKLSGGLRRLASFGMAVVAPPPVLLIDEPTNDVDPVRRPLIWRHLRRLADAGHIVVVVTHNLLEVERTADRYVLLHRGRVVQDSTPRQLAAQSRVTLAVSMRPEAARVGTPEAADVRHDEGLGQLQLQLEPAQVLGAVAWALELVDSGRADSYALAPASLESLYEGMTR